jgi:hypothetical protein
VVLQVPIDESGRAVSVQKGAVPGFLARHTVWVQ